MNDFTFISNNKKIYAINIKDNKNGFKYNEANFYFELKENDVFCGNCFINNKNGIYKCGIFKYNYYNEKMPRDLKKFCDKLVKKFQKNGAFI